MIDPRYSAGFDSQQTPVQYHRHHRRHKHKGLSNGTPVSRDESIHKVDQGQYQQTDAFSFGSGYGVPYGAAGYQQQQQQYDGASNAFVNQYQVQPGKPHRRHRRRHRHHHQSGGHGQLGDDIFFIERDDASGQQQTPPEGYELKGRIEVQCSEKGHRSRSRGQIPAPSPCPPSLPPPCPQPGGCPPGWQQVLLTPGASVPCPSGAIGYTGQVIGTGGAGGAGFAGYGGYSSQTQLVADYVFGQNGAGGAGAGGSSYFEQYDQGESYSSGHTKVVEVWQKRKKSKSRSRSRSHSRSFDFERFRNEILAAIERLPKDQHSGGSSTIKQDSSEVRVIVQPIQPVFYMPQQSGGSAQVQPGPAPVNNAPNVVYVPRNVYVPVIKPVFVPRERVIVRPQVIHVARPVLVDRPVPVTQRPIIIDRERPIPVPVRTGGGGNTGGSRVVREEYVYRDNLPVAYGGRCAEFAGGVNYGYMPTQVEHQYANSSTHESSTIYQNQGPVVTVNASEQYQQVPTGSGHSIQTYDVTNLYQKGGPGLNAAGSVGQVNQVVTQQSVQQTSALANLTRGAGKIEVLDTSVSPNWQQTNAASLTQRYGQSTLSLVSQNGQQSVGTGKRYTICTEVVDNNV